MTDPEIYGPYSSVGALSKLIASGWLKPSTLVADCLERIRALDDQIGAFLEVYDDEAMAAAEGHDRLIAAGRRIGPLHGIPVALKDLIEIDGKRTTGGSAFWRDRVSERTATVVRRLEAAGMIILGKTHMVEFGFGAWGTNAHLGTPWNPWDMTTHRVCGGSSSGSAAAVASGMVPVALGTDSGGSVRIPASLCGIVGFKPTYGRVSLAGAMYLCPSVDSIGPMVRSVGDAALLLDALQGPDPDDPTTYRVDPCKPLGSLKDGIAGLRLAALPDSDRKRCSDSVIEAYEAALQVLRDLGARVDNIAPPASLLEVALDGGKILAAEGYAAHKDWISDESLPIDPAVRRRILVGGTISSSDYIDTLAKRRRDMAVFDEFLSDFDAMVTPTTLSSAMSIAEVDEAQAPLAMLTRSSNYLELCSIAVPSGIGSDGMPFSLQFIGRGKDDARILRCAHAFEQATEWKDHHPQDLPRDWC
jgi:aspartyl-tRNA(Asn)/glutamyl-tRNA(Gln) amidotransferase subunit A